MDEATKKEITRLLLEQVEIDKEVEMDKDKPKDYMEALEIDRPDDWMDTATEEIKEFFKGKQNLFEHMTMSFVMKNSPKVLALFAGIPDLGNDVMSLQKLFFYVGYLKGLEQGEGRGVRSKEIDELDKLMGKETP